jgi:hypothetical protein
VPEGEDNAGEWYYSPVTFAWTITNGLVPPAAEESLMLYSLKDKVKHLPNAKANPTLTLP